MPRRLNISRKSVRRSRIEKPSKIDDRRGRSELWNRACAAWLHLQGTRPPRFLIPDPKQVTSSTKTNSQIGDSGVWEFVHPPNAIQLCAGPPNAVFIRQRRFCRPQANGYDVINLLAAYLIGTIPHQPVGAG